MQDKGLGGVSVRKSEGHHPERFRKNAIKYYSSILSKRAGGKYLLTVFLVIGENRHEIELRLEIVFNCVFYDPLRGKPPVEI